MGLSHHWWFWALATAVLALAAAQSRRYPALVGRLRRLALRRHLISLPPGQALRPPGRDLSWLAFPLAAWVAASPWIWGYDDAAGGPAADVLTAAAVLVLAVVSVVLPALWALVALAGLWLVVAPWAVGYGDAGGPVGISDVVAGVLLCTVSVAALASAERQVRTGSGAIGRLHRPPSASRGHGDEHRGDT